MARQEVVEVFFRVQAAAGIRRIAVWTEREEFVLPWAAASREYLKLHASRLETPIQRQEMAARRAGQSCSAWRLGFSGGTIDWYRSGFRLTVECMGSSVLAGRGKMHFAILRIGKRTRFRQYHAIRLREVGTGKVRPAIVGS